jgi:hypothetical protein
MPIKVKKTNREVRRLERKQEKLRLQRAAREQRRAGDDPSTQTVAATSGYRFSGPVRP